MRRNLLTAFVLAALCVNTLVLTVNVGQAQRANFEFPGRWNYRSEFPANATDSNQGIPTDCAVQPEKKRSPFTQKLQAPMQSYNPVTLLRFRQVQVTSAPGTSPAPAVLSAKTQAYLPREEIMLIDPSNYGDRYLQDINGNPADLEPLIVLHETVGSAASAINLFRTFHSQDDDQASYHTLIRQDGTVVYLVPPEKRAFGAGDSIFVGSNGSETVRTHPTFPPSVNNFAYHISLESPPDGYDNTSGHSGYTPNQYQSLAWLVAKTGVSDERITTHRLVDRSGLRTDPRTFSFAQFFKLLQTYTKTNEIAIRCTMPAGGLRS